MKIGQKIILGFTAIAMLFGLAGGLHVAHLLQTRSQIDRIVSANMGELRHAEEVSQNIQEAHSTILKLLLDMQRKTHEGHAGQISRTRDAIHSKLDKTKVAISAMEKTTLGQIEQGYPEDAADELREIRSLMNHVNTFSGLTDRMTVLLEAGDYQTARTFSEEDILPVSLSVQALVSDLEIDAQEEIQAGLTTTRTATQHSIWTGIVLTLAAFMAAVGLGLYLSRSISANVRRLHAATTLLGKGKLDTRVAINSRDEIGQIASDVNQMAEGLRNAIVSRDDLAKEVAARKKAAVMLVSQQTQAQSYLDIVDVMLTALDTEGNITLINRKGRQLLGYQEHEIIGNNWFEQCIAGDIRKDIRGVFEQLMAGRVAAVEYHENTVLTKTGEQILVAFHNAVIRDDRDRIAGILFSGEDITKRKQTEDDLRDSEEQIRLLLDSTEEAIYGLDLDGNCTFANAALLRLLAYDDASELIGKNIHAMMHHSRPDGSPSPMKECRACMSFRLGQGIHVDDEVFWRRDGSSFPVSYWSRPVRKDNRITGSVVTFLDISERIKTRDELEASGERLRASLEGTIAAVCKSVEARDPYTAGHQLRVAELAVAIAREMGCDEDCIEGVRMGASIHDIGKIQLPAEILSKPARLSTIEYNLVQAHAQVGYDILKDIEFPWPVADIAHQHHEHMDGSGYPQGLKGEDICLEARIVAVADVVEAINSHRPYRPAFGITAALEEITTHRDSYYDAQVVDACVRLFSENKFDLSNI